MRNLIIILLLCLLLNSCGYIVYPVWALSGAGTIAEIPSDIKRTVEYQSLSDDAEKAYEKQAKMKAEGKL